MSQFVKIYVLSVDEIVKLCHIMFMKIYDILKARYIYFQDVFFVI